VAAASPKGSTSHHDSQTCNGDVNHSESGSTLLDLFFGLVRNMADVHTAVAKAWKENASSTIRILKHARDIRGGKGEKEVIRQALLWLRLNKPKSYLLNIRDFTVHLGCFKDLLHLSSAADENHDLDGVELDILAEALREDIQIFTTYSENKADPNCKHASISLAAKWAPSEKGHFDKQKKLAKVLAQKLFPSSKFPLKEYRQILSKLRKHLNLVEVLMCERRWDEIDFGSVPSRAHKILGKCFQKHDSVRYQKYLADCQAGKAKINSGTLHPHELVTKCMEGRVDDTVEALWTDMVTKLRSSIALQSAVAVVDVSASMEGIPMQVAIALGLITAELSTPPFQNRVITFDSHPQWHSVSGTTLAGKVQSLRDAPWGGSTNLRATFDLILEAALNFNVPSEDMPKTLYIFSDMQFDTACADVVAGGSNNDTAFEYAQKKFTLAGYLLPQIVFWNLRATASGVPVKFDENRTALVSGFSPALLKLFMEGELSPMVTMNKAIEPYSGPVDAEEL
jgi:hypothetical protein